MSETRPIRVVLADNHAVVRKGIREFLEEDPTLHVIAEANDGEEAVELVAKAQPDVAVLDMQMPRMNGIEAARRVKKEFPQTRVLILSAYDDDPYIFAALQAGASGYLLKTSSSNELVYAVHAIASSESALSPAVAKKLVSCTSEGQPTPEAVEPLTEREMEILRLAAKGMGNKQIGATLAISDRTVQGHLANIYAKFHVNTRTEAVMFAVRDKWLSLP